MLYAMTSSSFHRALRTGRFSNINDYRRAAMLAERSFIDDTHTSLKIGLIDVKPQRGIAGQIFVFQNGKPSMMELIKDMEKGVMLNMELLYHRDQALQGQIKELEFDLEFRNKRQGIADHTCLDLLRRVREADDKLSYVQEYRFYETEAGKKGRGVASVMKNIGGEWCLWHRSDFIASFGDDLEAAICRAKKLVGMQ